MIHKLIFTQFLAFEFFFCLLTELFHTNLRLNIYRPKGVKQNSHPDMNEMVIRHSAGDCSFKQLSLRLQLYKAPFTQTTTHHSTKISSDSFEFHKMSD